MLVLFIFIQIELFFWFLTVAFGSFLYLFLFSISQYELTTLGVIHFGAVTICIYVVQFIISLNILQESVWWENNNE